MKLILSISLLISANAFAIDTGAMKAIGAKALEKGKEVASACKSEQVEFCKEYKKMDALKECLMKNKEKLSPGCKTSIGL